MRARSVIACFFVTLAAVQISHGSTLSVIQRLENIWGNIAFSAAEATIKVVGQKTGQHLTLRDVPLETFKVFVGRQHHLGVEIDGIDYQVSLNSELDVSKQIKALPESEGEPGGSGLVATDWWQLRKSGGIPLPDVTVAGPLELLLPRSMPIYAYLPHSSDVGDARRVVLTAGCTVTIKGLKSLALRRPVELPPLPMQYLAEVYAHVKLREPEEGFNQAPGILYLANELQAAAANLSSGQVVDRKRWRGQLLSFEVEPLGNSLPIVAAGEQQGAAAPKLKAKRLKDGTLEISPRQAPGATSSQDSLQPLSSSWAWPLPGVPLSKWVPYESVLRGILASHPFDLKKVQRQGVGLRLTKSSLKGISLISFDMHVRGKLPEQGGKRQAVEEDEEEEGGEEEITQSIVGPLEVWEVTVQLKEVEGGGWDYHPVNAKKKGAYYNTITLSNSAQDALLGNVSEPEGYDMYDVGLARNAP